MHHLVGMLLSLAEMELVQRSLLGGRRVVETTLGGRRGIVYWHLRELVLGVPGEQGGHG